MNERKTWIKAQLAKVSERARMVYHAVSSLADLDSELDFAGLAAECGLSVKCMRAALGELLGVDLLVRLPQSKDERGRFGAAGRIVLGELAAPQNYAQNWEQMAARAAEFLRAGQTDGSASWWGVERGENSKMGGLKEKRKEKEAKRKEIKKNSNNACAHTRERVCESSLEAKILEVFMLLKAEKIALIGLNSKISRKNRYSLREALEAADFKTRAAFDAVVEFVAYQNSFRRVTPLMAQRFINDAKKIEKAGGDVAAACRFSTEKCYRSIYAPRAQNGAASGAAAGAGGRDLHETLFAYVNERLGGEFYGMQSEIDEAGITYNGRRIVFNRQNRLELAK